MPNFDDLESHLLAQDAIWVGGGSTANLLCLWRQHGLDRILLRCLESNVVLSGVSAGSLCWHESGTTDSFGPELTAIHDGLGFIKYSNCVHYDAEEQRRPLYQRLVAGREIGPGYATDNGVGLVYQDGELVEAVSEIAGRRAYFVEATDNCGVLERAIEPRLLPGSMAQN
jgi:peptidase E